MSALLFKGNSVGFKLLDDKFAVDLDSARGGGMGKVYKATALQAGKPCAIKVIDPTHAGWQLHQMALEREIESLSKLYHANIVPILGSGDDVDLGKYIAMDWLEQDLDRSCRDKPFPDWSSYWKEVGDPILGALCYAFTSNCLHRDLKPGNVMFDASGVPKLIDFGISGMVNRLGIGPTLRHLRSNVYAPPEELPRDGLRDVYGFAAMAVYCLTGRHIESTDDLLDRFKQVQLPAGVHEVFAKCLATDPDDRPENVIYLREQLRRATPESLSENGAVATSTILLRFGGNALDSLRRLNSLTVPELIGRLNTYCFVEESQYGAPTRLMLLCAEYTLIVDRDSNNPAALYVIAVMDTYADSWNYAQERSLKVESRFRDSSGLGRLADSEWAIQNMLRALVLHKSGQSTHLGPSMLARVEN